VNWPLNRDNEIVVVEFTVGNFRSISAEQTLSFEAANGESLSDMLIVDPSRPDDPVLPSLFLFGGNASGKTNICKAIQAVRDLTMFSATMLNRGQAIPQIEPNRLLANLSDQPSSFRIKLLLNGELWDYRIQVDSTSVRNESLHRKANSPKARWSEVFTRTNGDKAGWVGNAARLNRTFFESVRENCSVLSKAAAEDIAVVLPVYDYISKIRIRNLANPPLDVVEKAIESSESDPALFQCLARIVACADIQVNEIQIDEKELAVDEVPDWLRAFNAYATEKEPSPKNSAHKLKFLLNRDDGAEVGFELQDLSDGTVRFLALVINILQALKDGSLLVMDEFDASLHTLLALAVRDLLTDADLNKNGAQFIAVTHSDALLDSSRLRRDQIVAINRLDGIGTTWWALSELDRKPKKDESFQRRYLNGGYGGVPRIADLRAHVLAALRGAGGA
jgi:AAA15 family ATPase/GTPase